MQNSAVITVIGRLARDVERANEKAPYKTAIAVDDVIHDGKELATDFFELTIWENNPAGFLVKNMAANNKTITKGSFVQVSGKFIVERYKNKEEQRVERRGILVSDMIFVSTGTSSKETKQASATEPVTTMEISEEEIPL